MTVHEKLDLLINENNKTGFKVPPTIMTGSNRTIECDIGDKIHMYGTYSITSVSGAKNFTTATLNAGGQGAGAYYTCEATNTIVTITIVNNYTNCNWMYFIENK